MQIVLSIIYANESSVTRKPKLYAITHLQSHPRMGIGIPLVFFKLFQQVECI